MGNQRLLVHLDTRSSNQIDRKMSWQSYVDEQLIASGMVTAAAIAGHDGNIWAKSNGFNASPDEVKRLLSNWGPNLAMGGVTVNAFKYMFLSSNEKAEGKERQLWCPHLQDKPGCHYRLLQRANCCRTVCRHNREAGRLPGVCWLLREPRLIRDN